MEKVSAGTGIEWIRQGFVLFRKQPAELSMLFLLYMLLMFSLSLIPLVGQLLPLLLVPAFSMAFMQACVEIEADRKVRPSVILTSFRSAALGSLLRLGSLYLLAAIAAVAASTLVDDGLFWNLMSGQMKPEDDDAAMGNLMAQVAVGLEAQGFEESAIRIKPVAHLAYRGSDTTLPVVMGPLVSMVEQFELAHRRRFGFISPDQDILIETLVAEGSGAAPAQANAIMVRDEEGEFILGRTKFYSGGQWHEANIYRRDGMALDPDRF